MKKHDKNCKCPECGIFVNTGEFRPLKINIVNYEHGMGVNGILTKYAKKMEKELIDLGEDVTVSDLPDPKADVNHHINYMAAQPCPTKNTTMVTHFTSDMFQLEQKLDKMAEFDGIGICFSQGIMDYLIEKGINKNNLRVVLPAHDSLPRRPRIIAVAFNVYPDGRKREQMFIDLIRSLKDQKKYAFRIIGKYWKPILDKLADTKVQFQYVEDFTLDFYTELLNTSDYMLYTGGEDAMAQCIVDAKNAGLRIIAPQQTDVQVEYPFETQKDLDKIFEEMVENPVEDWTWESYTKKHLEIWRNMK